MPDRAAAPVRFAPTVEQVGPDEADTIRRLEETIGQIQETTARDYGAPVRGVHAKGHGLLRGRLSVIDGLSPELAQGLFAQSGEYDVVLRFSTAPGDILDDSVSSPRGVALKVLDIPGERLDGTDAADGQDFIMVNGPAFGNADARGFLPGLKGLAVTTDKVDGLKQVVSAALQTVEGALEAVGMKSPLIATLGGQPNTHPLGDVYYSQVAFRYGDHIAKFSLAPVSPHLVDLRGDMVNADGRPDALREDIREVIGTRGGEWEFRVQLCVDLDEMPVEDASVIWDEEASPFRAVARIVIDPQSSWDKGVSDKEEADLAFSPWHGLAAFRPLGNVNRARKTVYEKSQAFRGALNRCPMRHAEPVL